MTSSNISVSEQSLLGYLPATIIQNLINNKINLDSKLPYHYTVHSVALFADISGFTKLSEGFAKKGRIGPEFLQFCLNRYLEQIINIIGTNGGDIFKFVGDAIMVIWPPEHNNKTFLKDACRRAIQCALSIQKQLHNHKISENKSLSVKIGIGVGECKILFVGGIFKRCEYLCVGDAMKQACDSEGMAECGGQTLVSENVKRLIDQYYTFIPAKSNSKEKFYIVDPHGKITKIKSKAEAYLIRTSFSSMQIKEKMDLFRYFIPRTVPFFLNIEKEQWLKEIRLVSAMFLNLKVDLSHIQGEEALDKVQRIAATVQRCIYRTHGALNKFLMDDKGSVMLNVWGIPPYSSPDDPICAVVTGLTIVRELEKIGYNCVVGITTGTCFSGVCGTLGNRREYSLLGEVVNLSARYMSKAKEKLVNEEIDSKCRVLIDENTKQYIQSKIKSEYVFSSALKGFSSEFNFYRPIENDYERMFPMQRNPFPFLRTHNEIITTEPSKYLKKNLTLIGNNKQRKLLIQIINKAITNKKKRIISIRGEIGTGKTLFIKTCLYEVLSSHAELSKIYLNSVDTSFENSKLNFVLCSFQCPFTYNQPMNGLCRIARYVYLQIIKHEKMVIKDFTKDKVNYQCDCIGKMIISTNNISNVEFIEDILYDEASSTCVELSKHFSLETYQKIIQPNLKNNYYPFIIKNNSLEKDRFFTSVSTKANYTPIIAFIMELLLEYRRILDKEYSNVVQVKIPLFIIIEDTQNIDRPSIDFLLNCVNYNSKYEELKPFILIYTYQTPLIEFLRDKRDLIYKEDTLIDEYDLIINDYTNNNVSVLDYSENKVISFEMQHLVDYKQVEQLLILNLEDNIKLKYNSTIKRIDKELIEMVLNKSFNGIPLFIIDIVTNLIASHKYTQFLSEELDVTSELKDMNELLDWSSFKIPERMEKLAGTIIDKLDSRDIIILKYASVMGTIFDSEKLKNLLPFKNLENNELYKYLLDYESKDIIEILYDLHLKHKKVVCKFSFPFIREICYQRMLIEQKSEIHFSFSKMLQVNEFRYLPQKLETKFFEHHLEIAEQTIMKQIHEDDENQLQEMRKYLNTTRNKLNITNMKIKIVKDICERLNMMNNRLDYEEGDYNMIHDQGSPSNKKLLSKEQIEEIKKMRFVIRSVRLEKKSDGKITWESRHFVITKEKICYYYNESEYKSGKVPLASFLLEDVINIEILENHYIGGKSNLFTVSVTKWIKKEVPQGPRTYYFSCNNKEELFDIIITIKFLKVKATYTSFCKQYGLIRFPLYKRVNYQIKKHKFSLNEEKSQKKKNNNNNNNNNSNNNNVPLLGLVRERSKKSFHLSSPGSPLFKRKSSNAFAFGIIMQEELKQKKQIENEKTAKNALKQIMKFGFANIIAVIQYNIEKNNDDDEFFDPEIIRVPRFLPKEFHVGRTKEQTHLIIKPEGNMNVNMKSQKNVSPMQTMKVTEEVVQEECETVGNNKDKESNKSDESGKEDENKITISALINNLNCKIKKEDNSEDIAWSLGSNKKEEDNIDTTNKDSPTHKETKPTLSKYTANIILNTPNEQEEEQEEEKENEKEQKNIQQHDHEHEHESKDNNYPEHVETIPDIIVIQSNSSNHKNTIQSAKFGPTDEPEDILISSPKSNDNQNENESNSNNSYQQYNSTMGNILTHQNKSNGEHMQINIYDPINVQSPPPNDMNNHNTNKAIIEDNVVHKLKCLDLNIINEEDYFQTTTAAIPELSVNETVKQEDVNLSSLILQYRPKQSYSSEKKQLNISNSLPLLSPVNIRTIPNIKVNKDKKDLLTNKPSTPSTRFSEYKYINPNINIHNKVHVSNFFNSLKK